MSPTVHRAHRLRALGYVPGNRATIDGTGREVEIQSYPFPSRHGFSVMVRTTPSDPTTLVRALIPDEAVDLASLEERR